jgi:hypothetical protein
MRRLSLVLTLSTLALLLAPAPAGAETAAPAHAPIGGITRPISSTGAPVAVQGPDGPLPPVSPMSDETHEGKSSATCTICGPMNYYGGSVMHSAKVYTIFWGPDCGSSPCFPANYRSTINQFFQDMAADSGGTDNVYSVATQYYKSAPGAINYSVSYGGTYQDTSAPSGSCSTYSVTSMGVTTSTCLYGSEIETKIDAVISSQNWASDGNTIFFFFTPQHVGSQFGSPASPGSGKAYSDYCGYHSVTTGGHIFANQPYAAEHGTGSSFTLCEALYQSTTPIRPNNNAADGTLNVVAHELMEAVTDSFWDTSNGTYAWTDSHKGTGEIGDKCNFLFGKSASSATDYNQTIHNNHYWLQEMYSNLGAACASSLKVASAKTIAVTGTGFATSGVTADVGTATGISPATTKTTSLKLTGVQGPLTGSSQVDITVNSGGLSSTLVGGYSWGPKVTSAKLSKGVITIAGSGFSGNVTVDLTDSLTQGATHSFTGLTPTTTTATSLKVTAPTTPTTGSSEYDVTVHSGGYTSTLYSLSPAKGQTAFFFGPHATSAKASKGVITIGGMGFNTSSVTVDMYTAGTANAGGSPVFSNIAATGTPTATSIKIAEPTAPTTGTSEYDIVVHSSGLTTTLLGGSSSTAFAFGPHVVSAKASKGLVTITGSGFATDTTKIQVYLKESGNTSNAIGPLTPTKASATSITITEPTAPTSGASEYDIDIKSNGLESYLFSQAPKNGQTGFAFGAHVTAAK